MSLSNPRIVYGIHSWSPYSRTTGSFYGILKVLQSSGLSFNGALVELNGGSLKYPWAVEDALISAEMSIKFSEYPDFLFQLFMGHAPTEAGPLSGGQVSTAVNVKGSSIVAATGILTPTITTASDLKFAKYTLVATDATHVDVYASSDEDFQRGTAEKFQNDSLKITASPLAISTGTPVAVPGFGLTLTGGASATSFVAGDTATFEVIPPATKEMEVTIGSSTDVFPEFGAIVMAKQRGNGEMFEIDCFRCKAVGMPLPFEINKFSEGEVKAKVFYDSVKDAVAKIRHVSPS